LILYALAQLKNGHKGMLLYEEVQNH
jgi:hypothetical protein